MEHGYCINLKNGLIIHRYRDNEDRDNSCVLFAPLSDKVAEMIFAGEVNRFDVIRAINNRIRTADDFNLEKYIEDRVKMNVRIQSVDLEAQANAEEQGVPEAKLPGIADVSLAEIKGAESSRKGAARPVANTKAAPASSEAVEQAMPQGGVAERNGGKSAKGAVKQDKPHSSAAAPTLSI